MIASHNTFSYLQSRYKIFNFFNGNEYDSFSELVDDLIYRNLHTTKSKKIHYRLILERGNRFSFDSDTDEIIRNQIKDNPNAVLNWVVVKKGWKTYYQSFGNVTIVDECFKNWNIFNLIYALFGGNPIKRHAEIHDAYDNGNIILFKDYIKSKRST